MANCKDCLSVDICYKYRDICAGRKTYNEYFDDDVTCSDFIDRTRFVELPCKFLYKCFVLPTIENNLPDITEMKCIGFSLSHDSYNANLITDKNKLYQPRFGAFGKTVFLTREEAERALKERENNG